MITEDYVSFETAKLLKEKGFNEPCECAYSAEGQYLLSCYKGITDRRIKNDEALDFSYSSTSPTHQMTMKWLREVYKIHIIAEPCLGEGNEPNLSFNRWFWTILIESGEYKPIRKIDEFPTYEKACEAAIKYSLKNLI